ncbi:WD repeat-containing protein WRAP73 isoform X5 [Manis pentadactyla]|uniref:WD repeat-containing protein WRAP73 isoform X5 n=1 Tax=Manis pentadactyla TaxID=143292 RepID=UPI00255C6DE4|nr:WD repeat-containing protein WRAP73 isoform X5 [Manis pentadactyla]
MNFSEVFKLSSLLCKFSPDGKYLAACVQYRLVVRDVSTLQVLQLYTCLDQIQHIEWSADSLFILCAMYKRGLVQVWSLEQPEWHCRIDEGSAGLAASCWSPDGRHILNTTEFHLRITVWSLCTKSVSYIKYPKACQQGISFTRDGRYMALAERRDCRDHVSVFVCSDWQLLRYKMLLYSLDGRLLSVFCAYEWSLGIKSVAWSPSSQFLAVGSYDGKVRVLNHVTWKAITEFEHPTNINNPKIPILRGGVGLLRLQVVYKEAEKSPQQALDHLAFPPCRAAAGLSSPESKYEIASVPVSLQMLKPAADRANPKIGIGALAFSPDSYFLATRNDNVPNAVWIWDVRKLRLFAVLEQLRPVRSFHWDPQQPRLAICTGGSKVYLWSPAGCVSVQVPGEGDFHVLSLCWHLHGGSLALLSKDHFCLCFLDTVGVGTAGGQQGNHT